MNALAKMVIMEMGRYANPSIHALSIMEAALKIPPSVSIKVQESHLVCVSLE